FSKDAIIEAVELSHVPGHAYAHVAVLAGVFITAFYSFRMLFMAFHGPERFHHDDAHAAHGHDAAHAIADDAHAHEASHDAGDEPGDHHGLGPGEVPHETPWVVTVPLILLA